MTIKVGCYIGKGNVMITKEDKKLTADFIRFDQKAMKVYAKGHVIMTARQDTLTGTSMEMNLEAETGTVYNGTIFMKEKPFFNIKGDTIQKIRTKIHMLSTKPALQHVTAKNRHGR